MAYVSKLDVVGTSTTHDIGSAGTGRLFYFWLSRPVQLGATQQWSLTVDGKATTIRKIVHHPDGGDGAHGELFSIDEAALGASAGTVNIVVTGGDVSMHLLGVLEAHAGATSWTFGDSGSAANTAADIAVTGIDSAVNALVVAGVMISGSGGWSWQENPITSPLVIRAEDGSGFQSMLAEGREVAGATNKTYTVDFEGGSFYTVMAVGVFTPNTGGAATVNPASALHGHAVTEDLAFGTSTTLVIHDSVLGHTAQQITLTVVGEEEEEPVVIIVNVNCRRG